MGFHEAVPFAAGDAAALVGVDRIEGGALHTGDSGLKLFPVHLSVAVLVHLPKAVGGGIRGRGTQGQRRQKKQFFHSCLLRILS